MKDSDRIILEYYKKDPNARQIDIAAATGITTATIRNIRSRLKRAGLTPWAPAAKPAPRQPDEVEHETVLIAPTTNARIDPDRYAMAVTLPRLRFAAAPFEEAPLRAYTPPVRELTREEEIRMRNRAMIEQVHKDGLRRGMYRVRSR